MSSPVYIFLAAYWTVLVVELIGDKTIYTVTSLAVRFRAGLVFGAMTIAFGGKMFAAVLLGAALVQLPLKWAALLSAAVFFSAALVIWFRKPEQLPAEGTRTRNWSRATLVSFASLFFTEWGDPGQIATAALTAQFQSPLATWLGGTLAMATKGAFALLLGVKLRARIPDRMLRILASTSCCVLGMVALGEALFQ